MIRDEEYGESDTGNWNAAKIYSRDNIAKLLVEFDELLKICHFGTIELADEFQINDETKAIAKLKAIRRAVQVLRMIIGNTRGVLKKSELPKFSIFKDDLTKVKKVLPYLHDDLMRNGKIIKHGINEVKYYSVLDILEDMHEDMIEPLNLSNLIFNPKEDFDPKKQKLERLKEMAENG